MKCLVLGGGGFLGSHLVDALLTQGHTVRVFDRVNPSRLKVFNPHPELESVEGDFVNRRDVVAAATGCDYIYHLISTTLPRSSNDNPGYDVETNVAGTLHLLEAVKTSRVRKIIFVSSGGTVYGVPRQVPISEDHPTEPLCSYGIAKLAIEKYLNMYQVLHGVDYCVLRMGNPFGARQRPSTAQGAVAVFLHKALRDETIEIWGDGSVVRDYFHVSDAVSAFLKAMSHSGDTRIFNIGGGTGRSLNDILAAIEALLGRPVKRSYSAPRPFDVPANVLDITRARKLLGWTPQMPFEEGLSLTAKWIRENG